MRNKTIQLSILTILLAFLYLGTSKAYSATDNKVGNLTQKSKETKNKKDSNKEIVADEIPENSSAVDSPAKEQKAGPPYPFIYENTDKDQLSCRTTTFVEPEYNNLKPTKKGNNLMRKPGSSVRASGNYIQINGIIVDENCLPIQDAVVEIWQTDTLGRYEWEYDTTSYWELPVSGKDNNFLFSGSAQTDNMGQFNILTIFPGSKEKNAPYINITIKRIGYDELHTRMYFADHPLNDTDPTLLLMNSTEKKSVIATGRNIDPKGKYEGRVFYFPITMAGISAYKRF